MNPLSVIAPPQPSNTDSGPVAGSMAQQGGASPGASGGNQPNWWEKLLPTAGGVIGGAVGLPLNLLDSVTGIGGTAADVGLAGLGGGIGKALENKLTGQSALQTNDLTSGLEQGAGQAAGLGIGKLFGMGASALGNLATGRAANIVGKEGVDQATQALTDEAANKATMYGEAVKAAKDPSIGANFQSTLDNAKNTYGIDPLHPSAPDLMSQVGHAQTGGSIENGQGALNQKIDEIIGSHGGKVNLGNLNDELTQAVAKQNGNGMGIGTLDDLTAKGKAMVPAGNPAQQAVKTLSLLSPKLSTVGGTGLTASSMSSEEGNQLAKALQKIAYNPIKTNALGVPLPVEQAKSGIAKGLYNYVRGEVDNQPGLSGAVKDIRNDPELENFVDSKVANISDPNVQAATKAKLMDSFQNATRIQHLRSAQSDAVPLSKLGDHVSNFNSERTYTATAPKRAGVGQSVAQNANNLATGPLASVAELALAGPTHGLSAIPLAYNGAKAVMNNPSALSTIGGALGGAATQTGLPVAGGVLGNLAGGSLNDSGAANTDVSLADAGGNTPAGGVAGQPPANGNVFESKSPQEQAIAQEILYNMFAPGLMTDSIQNNAYNAEQSLQKTQNAKAEMPQLKDLFNQAGGAQGPIKGLLSGMLAKYVTGGAAAHYGSTSNAMASQLAAATGTPESTILGMLPQITQNQSTAQAKLANVQALIDQLGGNTNINPASLPGVAPAQ